MMFITKNINPDTIFEHACHRSFYGGFLHRALLKAFLILCVLIFFFCFHREVSCGLTSPLSAQKPSLQLSPTDILMPYLEQAIPDMNSPATGKQSVIRRMPFGRTPKEDDTTAGPTHLFIPYDTNTANSAVDVNQELRQTFSAFPAGLSNPLGRQLWRAGIGFYEDQEDKQGESELKRLIEQIRAFEVKSAIGREHVPESAITIEPKAAATEPNEAQSDVELTKEVKKRAIESSLTYQPITDQTLQILADYAKDPNQIDNPFGLAEILYFSGRLREAVGFYQQALNRMDKTKAEPEQSRAWILFQLGNCLRDYDRPAAKKMYVRLITEYPQSAWADLAKVWEKLINLYLEEKPETLINER